MYRKSVFRLLGKLDKVDKRTNDEYCSSAGILANFYCMKLCVVGMLSLAYKTYLHFVTKLFSEHTSVGL
jgi:hypothetical protein